MNRFVGPTEVFVSGDTLQLKDYSKTDWQWTMFNPQAKQQRHDTVLPEVINEICDIELDDGVTFVIKEISGIMDEMEYPGIRVGIDALLDGMVTPIKLDISTGDAITPRAIEYHYNLMLENRSICLWSQNLKSDGTHIIETVSNDDTIKSLWESYRKKYSYATDIEFKTAIESVSKLYGYLKQLNI